MPITCSSFSREVINRSIRVIKAIKIECNFRNPNWELVRILYDSRNSRSLLYITFPKTFDRTHSRETGRKLLNINESSDLYKGFTFAIFNSVGKMPSCSDWLHKYTIGSTINGDISFSKDAYISSYPAATFFRDPKIWLISTIITSERKILFANGWPIYSISEWPTLGIFPARFGPILMKKSLKVLLITDPSVVKFSSFNLNLDCDCLALFLFTIFLMIFHVFLISLWRNRYRIKGQRNVTLYSSVLLVSERFVKEKVRYLGPNLLLYYLLLVYWVWKIASSKVCI